MNGIAKFAVISLMGVIVFIILIMIFTPSNNNRDFDHIRTPTARAGMFDVEGSSFPKPSIIQFEYDGCQYLLCTMHNTHQTIIHKANCTNIIHALQQR